jgi:uncharacterized FAD-dependent dehydrogenase
MIRITDISLPFNHSPDALADKIFEHLKISKQQLIKFTVVRKSIDARHKSQIAAIYTVNVELENDSLNSPALPAKASIISAEDLKYKMPDASKITGTSPIIVGSGPSGLFAALILAQLGLKPILIERGRDVASRIRDVHNFWNAGKLNTESNVQFGEGGAGTFSDGKLTTQIKDKFNRCTKVLEEFVKAGAPEEILYNSKPHIGTDNLVRIIKNIRSEIISLGGEVRFQTKLTGIKIISSKIAGAVINDSETIETNSIILALGHSARDTFDMLNQLNIPMQPKAFSIGVRIEHPQQLIDKSQFGRFAGHPALGAADYKLVHHCPNGRSAYTFCMCPGGEVIASSSEPGQIVTNGMSHYSRNHPNANSAILVGITPTDFKNEHPLAGMEFQRKWESMAFKAGGENYFAPIQLVGDFLAGKASKSIGQVRPTYTPGVTPTDISRCLPDFVADTIRFAIPEMDKKLKGFAMNDAVMTAVESRSSSPVRIIRDETFQCPAVKGLYPAGEGAGYAGGIISAAVDGIKVAEAVVLNMLNKSAD